MAKRTQPAKRHRRSLKRRERNYAYRSRLRTYLRKARQATASDAEDKHEKVAAACRELDRMVTKGVIDKNNASRSKSRLMKALQGSGGAQERPGRIPEPRMELGSEELERGTDRSGMAMDEEEEGM